MAKVSVRQPRQVEDEQVQGRAAFEHQAVLEERMTAESFRQVEQVNDLLEHFGAIPRYLSLAAQPLPGSVPGGTTRYRPRRTRRIRPCFWW